VGLSDLAGEREPGAGGNFRMVKIPQNKESAIDGTLINRHSPFFLPKSVNRLTAQGATVLHGCEVLPSSPMSSERIVLTVPVDRGVEAF